MTNGKLTNLGSINGTQAAFINDNKRVWNKGVYIVGCLGASQLGGSLLGIPPGYKANKLNREYISAHCQKAITRLCQNFPL